MKRIENVHIIGMGALGMLYGSMIAKNIGSEHVAYIMDAARYERYKSDDNKVNGVPVKFEKIKAQNAKPCDLLIVAVKYTGLRAALDVMKNSIGEDTIIISVLNGISSEEIIGERYGMDHVIYTIAQGMDAMHFGPELKFSKSGQLCVGITDPAMDKKLQILTEFFDRAGIAYTVEADIRHRMWGKFMLNVGINQTCMVYGTCYAGAMTIGSQEAVALYSAMREVILVANAEGVKLTEKDLEQYIGILKTLAPDATPSMGQDRINKRPSEVELFAGTVIRLAKKHGISVPTNEFLYKRVHEIEAEYAD